MPPRTLLSTFRTTPLTSIASHRMLSSTSRMLIKEDAERSPEEIEKKNQEQLKKQEHGKGHWHEGLASQGESNIVADKEHVKDHDKHMNELQQQTKKKGEKGEL